MAELTLEQRVQRIEDAEEIRRLRYLYCEYGNLYDAESFAALFAPDAIWDGGDAFGRQEGLEQIEQMVRDAGERIRFSAHYITNELIEVNGDSATGRWWLFMPCVLDGESTWLFATYDDEYVKLDGRWLIKQDRPRRQELRTPGQGLGRERQGLGRRSLERALSPRCRRPLAPPHPPAASCGRGRRAVASAPQ